MKMNNSQQFQVGDKIVDYGQVYRVFKIKKDRIFNGEKEDCIYYKPYFKIDKSQSLVCSIPQSNIEEANLRKPVSKKKINETLQLLAKKPDDEIKVTIKEAEAYFKENDPVETARLLRLLWLEKQDEEKKGLATRKKMMYQNALRHLVEEMSVVQKIGLKEAKKKIRRRLKKICPEKKEEKHDK
jgi:RNA polymerase-interacting CarD/CdnL/TRCF family regulator